MREILFRGKRVDNGEWIYGYYARKGNDPENYKHFIVFSNEDNFDCRLLNYPFYLAEIEVDPLTVGQYIGLTDKNGNKIFEGDIIKRTHHYGSPFDDDNTIYTDKNTAEIKWDKENACFMFDIYPFVGMYLDSENEWEVIGNVIDNPELLKGE